MDLSLESRHGPSLDLNLQNAESHEMILVLSHIEWDPCFSLFTCGENYYLSTLKFVFLMFCLVLKYISMIKCCLNWIAVSY